MCVYVDNFVHMTIHTYTCKYVTSFVHTHVMHAYIHLHRCIKFGRHVFSCQSPLLCKYYHTKVILYSQKILRAPIFEDFEDFLPTSKLYP